MSAIDLATARLKSAEGFRGTAYRDIFSRLTIGYGFCVDAGILEPEAAALLAAQIATRATALQAFRGFQGLDEVRQSVLIELAVNLGVNGLLGFSRMLNAIASGDWQTAHDELLASKAATQLPARYGTLAQMLLTGVNQ